MLDSKSATALDWDAVLEALANEARSARGQEEARTAPLAQSLHEAQELYQAVEELEALESLGDRMPTGGLVDTRTQLDDARKGRVLEIEDLYVCAQSLRALFELQCWLSKKEAPVLCKELESIVDASQLHERLKDSFLGPNEFNPKRYPKLAKLKAAILSAQSSIQRQMEALLSSPQLQDLLQDRFVTQRNGRSVLPIRASAKRTGIGIVHDSSSSGETVFIEPKEVIELHNQQRLAEAYYTEK